MDPRERWVRLAVHVHTYKYNLCLLTLHQRPIFCHGWHLAGLASEQPYYMAICDSRSGQLLLNSSKTIELGIAANSACEPSYCPGSLEMLTTWTFPGPNFCHRKDAQLHVSPIQGFDLDKKQWEL